MRGDAHEFMRKVQVIQVRTVLSDTLHQLRKTCLKGRDHSSVCFERRVEP